MHDVPWGPSVGTQQATRSSWVRRSPYAGLDEFAPGVDMSYKRLFWWYPTNSEVRSSPCFVDGMVWVGSLDGGIYTFNAISGELVEHHQTTDWVRSSPGADSHRVFIVAEPDKQGAASLLAYSTQDYMELLWTRELGGANDSSPVAADGAVYVGSANRILAFDGETGVDRWSFEWEDLSGADPFVSDGVVYASADHQVLAIDANKGSLLWSAKIADHRSGPPRFFRGRPAAANGIVHVGSDDHHVYALSADSGDVLWRYRTGGPVRSTPTVAEGIVYVGSDDGSVYALDQEDGRPMWRYEPTGMSAPIHASPCVSDGLVFVGTLRSLAALHPRTGKPRWQYGIHMGDGVSSSPCVSNGVVYFGANDCNFYALRVRLSFPEPPVIQD